METLAASLRLVRDALPDELVDDATCQALAHLGTTLAPIHCAGFEVRLAAGAAGVDLIQRIRSLGGEPERLRRHLASGAPRGDQAWRAVDRFCAAWQDPCSTAHRRVAGAFLEIDAAAGATAPSLYLSLEAGSPATPEQTAELVAEIAAEARAAPLSQELERGIAACARALPEGAEITDVGFMLARPIDAVRLVAAPLRRPQVAELLAALDWHGTPPVLDQPLRLVPEAIEHVALSLDIAARALPRVGLEYYPGPYEHDLPLWKRALDALVAAGLCAPAKHDALLRWPGYLEPVDADGAWPAGLLVESLLNRSDQFLVLARRLTFLKLVCSADRPPVAKAYFGYGPRSFAARTEGTDADATEPRGGGPEDGRGAAILLAGAVQRAAPAAPHSPPAAAAPATPKIALAERRRAATEAAASYLLGRRDDAGMWREFPRILRGTDEWATAYIATAVAAAAGTAAPGAIDAARQAWETLTRRRGAADGWGYNGDLPQDADSTLWGLALADAVGEGGSPRACNAAAVLERHVDTGGGVATYVAAEEGELRRLLGELPIDGMFAPHVCVSAAAAHRAPLAARITPFLLERQDDDGRWRGYWWSDDEYTTALAVAALRTAEGGEAAAAVARARSWARARMTRRGPVWSRTLGAASVFATALCVDIVDDPASCADAIAWLLAAQRPDGSWPPSALMRMPPPWAVSGDEDPRASTVSVDDGALFTTATVLRTMARLAARR